MPAPHSRHLARIISLAATAALLALPASAAAAKKADPLRGASLDAVTATLEIKTSRCPAAGDPSAAACGHADLESTFKSGPGAKLRRLGAGKLRVSGSGRSQCSSLSPTPYAVTAPDGSEQLFGPAEYIVSKGFSSTDISIATTRRGARWTWLEPTRPTVPCNYFFGSGPVNFERAVTSPLFGAARLRKRRFTVTLESTANKFEKTNADGSVLYGQASWKLDLAYRRLRLR